MPMDNTTAHTHGGGYSGRPVMAGAEPSPAVPSSKCSGRMQSMLLESAGQGRLDSIVSLMDLAPNILDSKGQYGISAAHIAAYYGHWHVLQFLAKKNTQHLFAEADDGGTPAHHAAAAGRTEALKFLASQSLSHMVTRDHDGWTPAHIASYYARTEVLILMAKVSPSVLGILTNDGRTPRDLASTPVCKQLVACLERLVTDSEHGNSSSEDSQHIISDLLSTLTSDVSKPQPAADPKKPSSKIDDREEDQGGAHPVPKSVEAQSISAGKKQMDSDKREKYQAVELKDRGNTEEENGTAVTWKQDITTKDQEGKWKILLADLRKGADLTSMLIPAEFIRPQSVLERLGFLMQHGKYLENLALPNLSPVDRMKAVVAFHVSGLVREVFDGKKPYNPVLGETCAWLYQHADAHCGVTRMVCEQVSHHPPISAMHIHNESLGITLEGAAQIDAKFTGNSVLVPFKGGRRLTIKGTNEVYHLTYPSLQYRGVMLGPKGAEWIGKMEIRCPHTKLVAKLDFKPMGWLGMWGAWHRVEGAIKSVDGKKEVVGAISGCWDKVLSFRCTRTGDQECLYDYQWASSHAKLPIVPTPAASLPTDSLVVWCKVSQALRAKDYRAANKEKSSVEVTERGKRAARTREKTPFLPRFFQQQKEGWIADQTALAKFHEQYMAVS